LPNPPAARSQNQTLKAIALMIAGAALLSANDAASKYLTQSYPIGQVICLRHAATLLVIVPYIAWVSGWRAARVVQWPGQVFRGLLFLGSAVFMVASLSVLPLSTVVAIVFASPIFVALLSLPLLNERVSAKRWLAVLIGFAGVLVIVRPGSAGFAWVLLLPVVCAFVNGLRDVVTRRLSRSETTISILLCSTVIVMLGGLASAPFGWIAVDANSALWFVVAGVCNAGAHFLLIEALRLGEAAAVAPFRYTTLLWATLFGFMLWHEVPSAWVAIGGLLIVVGGWYSVISESRRSCGK